MYKNQLQELAQRSCFNLPSYACIREGPDHAPRFKATVNFNGDVFESPSFCSTLRQAEHAAAEVALDTLSKRGPSKSLAAKVLDKTGVYKNLLQETAHRAGLKLPVYTTVQSGPSHSPSFSCTVELAGMCFSGKPAKTKKQAQKDAALAAWCALKQLPNMVPTTLSSSSSSQSEHKANDEQEQAIVAKVLSSLRQSVIHDQSILHVNNNNNNHTRRTVPYAHDINYCAMPFQNYPYPNFLPDVSMPQMWHHFNAPRPNILPFQNYPFYSISPLPQFEHPSYFPGGSQVTIQEIHDLDSSAQSKESQEAAKLQGWVPKKNFTVPAVQVRTVIPVCSQPPARPPCPTVRSGKRSMSMNNARCYPRRNSVAPAVQVRTVVPVCSAPPSRAPGPASEGSAEISSEFAKLQI